MSGDDPRDPWWTPAAAAGPDVPRRVAVTVDPAGEGVDADIAAGIRKAADALRDAGYEVEEAEPPLVGEGRDLFARLITAELRLTLYPLLKPLASADALRFLELSFECVPQLDYAGYIAAFARRSAIARAWRQFHARYPIVLGPVVTMKRFPVGFDIAGPNEFNAVMRAFRLTGLVNMLGLPAAVVPAGVADGLPQAVQIIGDRYREDVCLDAAEAIEARLGVVTPIDPR